MRVAREFVTREFLAALPLTVLASATALGASIIGTVTGPDGKPFMGAFVAAENPQKPDDGQRALRRAGALSHRRSAGRDLHGPHRGDRVCERARAAASRSPPTRRLSLDFALQRTPVRWSDLSTYQGRQLLPKTAKHDLSYKDSFFTTCFQSCHSFQKRMATQRARSRRLARARALHERCDARRPHG